MPVPTTDTELEPTSDNKPEGPSEPFPAPEPKPKDMSEVSEPATMPTPEGVLVEFEGMEWSPAHTLLPLASVDFALDLVEMNPLNLPSLLVPPALFLLFSPLVPPSSEFPMPLLVPTSLNSTEMPPLVSVSVAYPPQFFRSPE